ncbi:hypothetical protein LL645_004124 [Salmonella enterica]|nr:hypothetical protein [Salmonella enterica]EJT9668060.1 hypothetical protein [Salmonella enterica]EKO4095983.1 hypothetical protein [Salmonella enterica]
MMNNTLTDTIFDPRGDNCFYELQLAPRSSLQALRNGKVLFFDNTKLDFCHYREIFTRLKTVLNEHGINNIEYVRQSVRGTMTEQIRTLADKLLQKKVQAAVVALADMGTSVMTTILAIELEKRGIATLLIASPPGDNLAEHVAHYRAGQLCICRLDIYQASSISDIRQQIDEQSAYVLEALTSAGNIQAAAVLHPKMDLNRSKSGTGMMPYSDLDTLMDDYERQSIGDGLPVIPPTPARFTAMLEYCPETLDTVLIPEAGPSGKDIRVRDVVINSIMAGCKPSFLPIVTATLRSMASTEFNFQQSITTSYNGGNLVLVSGPIAAELGINAGQGCIGPGFRANATIGRAVNLTILNVCRAYPGKADLGCLGSPVEFTYCFAESLTNSPWPTLNEEQFGSEATTVYLLKAEPPTDVVDFLSQTADSLLEVIVDSATHQGRMNAYIPGRILIVLTPDHAQILHNAGWSKSALQGYLHKHIHNPSSVLQGKGLVPVRPVQFAGHDPMPATRSPQDIDLVVAGGRGGHSAILASWGLYSDAVLTPLMLPDGQLAHTIEDFRTTSFTSRKN